MKPTNKSLFPYYTKIDLSEREDWREYRFPGGETVRIENPQFLIVSDNGHRIGCGEGGGLSYYIPYGWICLMWRNRGDRKENFYCENPENNEGEQK